MLFTHLFWDTHIFREALWDREIPSACCDELVVLDSLLMV